MKKNTVLVLILLTSLYTHAQNVGIGTPTPGEKLDVNGNINLSGQLKINNNQGNARQYLGKDGSNNLAWLDLSDYPNFRVFDCNSTATTAGTFNCPFTFVIPPGITTIVVECWAGGGGGASLSGGAAGGYVLAKFDVLAGATATINVGAGGAFGSISSAGVGGGTSDFSILSSSISAFGGGGGLPNDPLGNFSVNTPAGGGFLLSTVAAIGFHGSSGGLTKLRYDQASSTEFVKVISYGDGGDAPFEPGSGAKGGYRVIGTTVNQNSFGANRPTRQGAGGAADNAVGEAGRGGRVIDHY